MSHDFKSIRPEGTIAFTLNHPDDFREVRAFTWPTIKSEDTTINVVMNPDRALTVTAVGIHGQTFILRGPIADDRIGADLQVAVRWNVLKVDLFIGGLLVNSAAVARH